MLQRWLTGICLIATLSINAQNVLKVTSGTTLHLTGGAVITLDNMDLDNDGTISLSAGSGTFRFSGNANNSISGSSMPLFDLIQLAKTGTASLQLQRNISAVSGISFISGLLNLNNNNILLQSTALLTGETETSRIIGANGGFVEIATDLNAPTSVNPGNLGAIITSSQNLGSTVVRRGHQVQNINSNTSINRYYDITPTNNTALNATLRFNYFDAETNSLDENAVVLWRSPDNVAWTEIGADTRSTSSNYVEKTGIAEFSRWTLSNPSGALPVIFTFINARCENGRIVVSWKTAQESNSLRFDVQRSTNGRNWQVIGSLPAAGNSNFERNYLFVDANPLPDAAIYRIAEYDINGRVMYTTLIRASCDGKDAINLWPNPAQEMAWLNIVTNAPSDAIVRLFDAKGSLVYTRKASLLNGTNQVVVPVQSLPAGVYHMRVDYGPEKVKIFKLVKY